MKKKQERDKKMGTVEGKCRMLVPDKSTDLVKTNNTLITSLAANNDGDLRGNQTVINGDTSCNLKVGEVLSGQL